MQRKIPKIAYFYFFSFFSRIFQIIAVPLHRNREGSAEVHLI